MLSNPARHATPSQPFKWEGNAEEVSFLLCARWECVCPKAVFSLITGEVPPFLQFLYSLYSRARFSFLWHPMPPAMRFRQLFCEHCVRCLTVSIYSRERFPVPLPRTTTRARSWKRPKVRPPVQAQRPMMTAPQLLHPHIPLVLAGHPRRAPRLGRQNLSTRS